ncbi:MAG: hypothetical protein R6W77_05795 [Trueperaceae bacterium]
MSFDLETLLGLFFFVVFIVLPLVTRSRSKQQRGRPGVPQRPPGQGAQGRTVPGTGAAGQGGTPTTLGRTTTASRGAAGGGQGGASTASGTPSDSPLAMLEEIRRRVQEAQERERGAGRTDGSGGSGSATQASSSTTSRPATTTTSAASTRAAAQTAPRTGRSGRPLVASDPFERGLVGGAEQRPAPPASLGREGAVRSDVPQRASAPPQLARSRSMIDGADVPTVRRWATGRAATRRSGDGLGARLGALGLDRMDRSTILHGLIWHEILDEPAAYRRLRRQRSRPL